MIGIPMIVENGYIHGYIPLKRVHKTTFLDIELYNQVIINMYIVLKLFKNTH